MHRQRLGTRQIYHMTAVAVGLGVMVKRSRSRYQCLDLSKETVFIYSMSTHE